MMLLEDFIEKYIDAIDDEKWDYVYEQATLHLEYPYDLTSKLLEAHINPLPHMTSVPYSYAPLEITSITIPSKCTRIEAQAFHSCKGLKLINLPEGLKVIDMSAFRQSGLTEILLPSSLIVLGPYAFAGCKDLCKIRYNGTINELKKIRFWEEVFTGVSTSYIQCTDGDVKLGELDE